MVLLLLVEVVVVVVVVLVRVLLWLVFSVLQPGLCRLPGLHLLGGGETAGREAVLALNVIHEDLTRRPAPQLALQFHDSGPTGHVI